MITTWGPVYVPDGEVPAQETSWKMLLNSVKDPDPALLSHVPPAFRVGKHPIAEYLLHLIQEQEQPPHPLPESWKVGTVDSSPELAILYAIETLALLCHQSLEMEDLLDRMSSTPPVEWESALTEADLSALLWDCVQILEPYSRYEPVASSIFAHIGSAIDTVTSSQFDKGCQSFAKSAITLGIDGLMGALQDLYDKEA